MIEEIKTITIILLLIYCVIVTYLIYLQYQQRDAYLKDKVDYINNKMDELTSRERLVSNREICDRELLRLKTIHKSALDVLNSYSNPIMQQQNY